MERIWQFAGPRPKTYSYLMDNSGGRGEAYNNLEDYERVWKEYTNVGRVCKEELLLVFKKGFKMY